MLAVRTANWWLEDKTLGRVTVGRLNVGGPVGTIDLGGISTVAHFSPGLVGGAFFVDGTQRARLGAIVGPTYGGDRIEGIRYDTANLGGFVGQATWGEDDVWSASLRYAGEFGGIRVAAGIGYQAQDGPATQLIQLDTGARNMDNEWSGSLALMHVASGLFAQGHYAKSEFFNGTEAKFWMVQGGITKNWFGLGNTSLYGEYGEAQDYIKAGVAGTCCCASLLPPLTSTSTASASCSRSMRRPWRCSSAGGGLRSTSTGCANVAGCFNGTQDLDSGPRRCSHPVLIELDLTLQTGRAARRAALSFRCAVGGRPCRVRNQHRFCCQAAIYRNCAPPVGNVFR